MPRKPNAINIPHNDVLTLPCEFFNHPLWEEKRTYSRAEAWLDMLAMAACEESSQLIGASITPIPRGGLIASVRHLGGRWGWSNTKVAKFLGLLESEGMIRTETSQRGTLILLCEGEGAER